MQIERIIMYFLMTLIKVRIASKSYRLLNIYTIQDDIFENSKTL